MLIIKQQKFFNKSSLTIFAIFLLALFLRLINLSTIPYGFHIDEIVSGYVGRFILMHGQDPYGNHWPLVYFDMFGDYRVILPMYINGLSTFIFGVNEFAVRFPTSFFGALIVFPIYSLSKIFFGKRKLSFLPPFLIAILPWHIVLSRATSEGILGLTVFLFGFDFLIKSLINKKMSFLFVGNFLLFLTYFMYPTFRVLTPALLLPFPILAKNFRKRFIVSLLIFIAFTGIVGLTVWGQGRFLQTSLFKNTDIANSIKGQDIALNAAEGHNNAFVARIFNNKIIGYSQLFISNYLTYFSPNFLFIKGGLPDRYVVPNDGLIFITLLIPFLFLLFPQKLLLEKKYYYLILYLFLTAPAAAVLTIDDVPNVHRDLFMMIPLIFLATIGLQKLIILTGKNKKILFCIVSILCISIIGEFIYFWHRYTVQAASYKSILRDDGNKQMILAIKKYPSEQVYIPVYEALPVYYLFYNNNLSKELAGKFQKGMMIDKINNVTFIQDWCPPNKLDKKTLPSNAIIVEAGDCKDNPSFTELQVIYRKDSTKAFRILKYNGTN